MIPNSLPTAKIQSLELIRLAPGVSRNMLFDTLTTLYTDYFTSAQAYKELESSNLIRTEAGSDKDLVDGSDDLIYITSLGEVMLEDLINTIVAPSLAELRKVGESLNKAVKDKSLIIANYEIQSSADGNMTYLVHLSRKLPDASSAMEININVPDEVTADDMCRKWHNDNDLTVYNSIIGLLGKK